MKSLKSLTFLLFLFVFAGFWGLALAEEVATSTPQINSNTNEAQGAITRCSDYYKFQSIKIDLKPDKEEYLPEEVIKFKGTLVNTNNYPIVDGYIFARVAKKNVNYVTEGNYIIDEFFGLEKISIDAKENKLVSFDWQVPSKLAGGNYTISFFYSVGKKFNLAGLPFSESIIGSSLDFKVNNVASQSVYLDRSKTKVNKILYSPMSGWPLLSASTSTVVTQPIRNTYKEAKTIKVKYELFYWDSLDANQDKISSKTEEILMQPNSTKELVYKIDRFEQASYYLRITATSDYDKSIVNVKFVSQAERPRLNYLALDNFPVKKGEDSSLFACFYNTSSTNTNGRVVVILSDINDNEIGRIDYNGPIVPDMMADKKDFVATEDYSYLKIKAEVYDSKSAMVDKYDVSYDCKDLGSEKCVEMAKPTVEPVEKSRVPLNRIIVPSAVLVVLIIAIIILIKRRSRV